MSKATDITQAVAAGISAVAAAVALVAVWLTLEKSNEANKISNESNSIAKDAMNASNQMLTLAEQQNDERFSSKVYIGEATALEARPFDYLKAPNQKFWQVVVNASGVQVEDTWLADENGRTVSIYGEQNCSVYALPGDFRPKYLYFTDPNGHWRREYGAKATKLTNQEFRAAPKPANEPSPWWAPLENCSG